MSDRLDMQEDLEAAFGSENVYYDPPESIQMEYPCIVYTTNDVTTLWTNGRPYGTMFDYQVTLIRKDPDDGLLERLLASLGSYDYDRHYISDGLYHDVILVHNIERKPND